MEAFPVTGFSRFSRETAREARRFRFSKQLNVATQVKKRNIQTKRFVRLPTLLLENNTFLNICVAE